MIRSAAVLLTGAVLIAACAAPSPPVADGTHHVSIDGQRYLLSPLTAGTWTATPGVAMPVALSQTPAHQSALVRAIETASGCQVTDSNYAPSGRQLDAQVVCAGTPAD